MIQIFVNANYDFVGKRRWFYIASAALIAISLLSILIRGGLNYGIDFTGGTLIQVRYDKPVSVGDVRRGLDEIKLGSAVIQQFGDAREYLIRLPQGGERPEQITPKVQAALEKASGAKLEMRRVEFVGPQVGRDLQLQALYAVLAGMAGILIYVAIRFDFRGGVISDRRHRPRRDRDPRRPVDLQLRDVAVRARGAPHDRGLLHQRHDRDLRPDPGEPRPRSPQGPESRGSRQHLAQPDAVSHDPDVVHDVHGLGRPLPVRREVLRDFAFALVVGVVLGTYSTVAAASLIVDWETWSRSRQSSPRKVPAKA